ncbi:MAG: FAD-dependent oxidoreductase [Rhizobiaceae bacterium]
MTAGIIIVGGGQAAASAVVKLRELDNAIPITMVCGEGVLPYQRPPLSKKYLSGEMPLERLVLRPQEWFDDHNVTVKLGARVEAIHRDEKSVTLFDGETLAYDKLLLATGSQLRFLPVPMGGRLKGVHYIRCSLDADAMRPDMKTGNKLVVIGGGYIGLEVSAIAAQMGMKVTVVEMADRILQRVAAPDTSDYIRELHRRNGVTIIEGVGLSKLTERDGKVGAAELTDCTHLDADIVLAGIGVMPNSELGASAGLALQSGITVDAFCQTSDADIYAAGDCASFDFHGENIRLESVPNAINQAEIAAVNMLGDVVPYVATPWFWSDQYDVKLQIAGLNTGYDSTLVRAGKREGAQSVWYYKGDKLLAVDAMNDAPSFMMARRIIEANKSVPKDVAADATSNLKEWT